MLYKNLNDKNSILLKCDCVGNCGGIEFVLDEEIKEVFVSVKPEGYNALHDLCFLGRLKQALKIIFMCKCYYDDIVVDKRTFQKFTNEVNKMNDRLNNQWGD